MCIICVFNRKSNVTLGLVFSQLKRNLYSNIYCEGRYPLADFIYANATRSWRYVRKSCGFHDSVETRFRSVERDATARLIKFSPFRGTIRARFHKAAPGRRSSSRSILINFHRKLTRLHDESRVYEHQRKPLPAGRAGLCGVARDSDTVRDALVFIARCN